jgi:transposase
MQVPVVRDKRSSRRVNHSKTCTDRSLNKRVILLANPEARFADLGPDWHARHHDRDRKIRAHIRQLQALGPDVTLTPAA